jgi:hypothetical protein
MADEADVRQEPERALDRAMLEAFAGRTAGIVLLTVPFWPIRAGSCWPPESRSPWWVPWS